jgi:hypothetical protein
VKAPQGLGLRHGHRMSKRGHRKQSYSDLMMDEPSGFRVHSGAYRDLPVRNLSFIL